MRLQIKPQHDRPLRIREHSARQMNPIVLTAVGACLVVGLVLAWIYYSGQQNGIGSEEEDHISFVESGESDRTLKPSGGMPEFPDLGSDESSGTVSEASRSNPFSSDPSRAIVNDDEAQVLVEEEQPVPQEFARAPKRSDSPKNDVAPKKADTPRGDLAISGRVQTRAGKPVSGIEVTARAGYVVDPDRAKLVSTRGYHHRTTSAYNGAYEFEQLASGEYQIRTTETEQYAQARISVRAGVDFADLVLVEHRDLRVRGVVSTAAGEPLTGTQVQSLFRAGEVVSTSSDKDGRYALVLKAKEIARSLSILASKDGYKDQKIRLEAAELDAEHDVELNIVMETDDTAIAVVSGTVRGSEGGAVVGQRISMSSTKTRQSYRATTDNDGEFVMEGVEPSDDYMLSINAADAYEDYFQRNLQVTEDDLTLAIELKAKDVGTLRGQMVDLYGNPIANFSLSLQTKKDSFYTARVVGDGVGVFLVENAPAGELRFGTRSNPFHRVEGIQLAAGYERDVRIVLDSGYDEIRGRVVDDRLNPVAVPNINLTWSHAQNGLRSTSRRTTAADQQGDFRFTQLGPGLHTVSINVPGYKQVRFNHDVAEHGTDIMVRLEAH